MPKYSKYERPDGYMPGDVNVLIRKNVVRDIGMATFDFGSLNQLVYGDFGLSTARPPILKLYGGSIGKRTLRAVAGDTVTPDSGIIGFHVPYTNTVHINASATERGGNSIMRVVAHELSHLADSQQKRLRTASDIAARYAVVASSTAIAHKLGVPAEDNTFVAGAVRLAWYRKEPCEVRAREVERSDLALAHIEDIVFPSRNT